MSKALFYVGHLVATPGALRYAAERNIDLLVLLKRHRSGDWGDMCPDDKRLNDAAVREGTRIFSSYQVTAEQKIWVITECDRSATTILTPEEY